MILAASTQVFMGLRFLPQVGASFFDPAQKPGAVGRAPGRLKLPPKGKLETGPLARAQVCGLVPAAAGV